MDNKQATHLIDDEDYVDLTKAINAYLERGIRNLEFYFACVILSTFAPLVMKEKVELLPKPKELPQSGENSEEWVPFTCKEVRGSKETCLEVKIPRCLNLPTLLSILDLYTAKNIEYNLSMEKIDKEKLLDLAWKSLADRREGETIGASPPAFVLCVYLPDVIPEEDVEQLKREMTACDEGRKVKMNLSGRGKCMTIRDSSDPKKYFVTRGREDYDSILNQICESWCRFGTASSYFF